MKKIGILFSVLVLMVLICKPVFAQEKKISDILRGVVESNFVALENEDIDGAMRTIHTQAPGYLQTMELSKQLFPYYDLRYTLLSFNYIGKDDEYALARGKQRTTKVQGPAFQNNIVDFIYVFKQEGDVWKFWSQAVLDTQFVQ
ncbi:MAG: hypothetical protein ABII88_11700 [Candidatus Omnitrophota bacterium]